VSLLAALLVGGATAATPVYTMTSVNAESLPGKGTNIVATVRNDAKRAGVVHLRAIEDGTSTSVDLGAADEGVLIALAMGLQVMSPVSEWDLMLPLGTGALPVTLMRDGDAISVEIGTLTKPDPAPSAMVLQSRYGIGELRSDGRPWDEAARRVLSDVLALLTPDERAEIEGLAFVRRAEPHATHRAAMAEVVGRVDFDAMYLQEPVDTRVEVYDRLFQSRNTRFYGVPSRPYGQEHWGLIHEVGHAIAARGRLTTLERRTGLALEAQRSADALNALIGSYNRAVERFNQLPGQRQTGEERALLDGIKAQIDVSQAEVEALGVRVNAMTRELNAPQESEVAARFAAVLGSDTPPTEYGRASIDEGFAECYALYKLDPDALRRVLPKVYAWFASEEYLR